MPAAPPPRFDSADSAEAAFYAAFEALDLEALGRVWTQGEESVCVHPGGGRLAGRAEVMQSWIELLSGAAPPRIEYSVLDRLESPGLAVHLVEERIRTGGDTGAEPARVLATNVYIREGQDGDWRLALHHASLPLVPPRGSQGRRVH